MYVKLVYLYNVDVYNIISLEKIIQFNTQNLIKASGSRRWKGTLTFIIFIQ